MNNSAMRGRSLLSWSGFSKEEIRLILETAGKLFQEKSKNKLGHRMKNKVLFQLDNRLGAGMQTAGNRFSETALALAFQKESGILIPHFPLAASEQLLAPAIEDMARIAGQLANAVSCGGSQEYLDALAGFSSRPVFNVGTNLENPLLALAEILLLQREIGDLRGKKLVLSGEGDNPTIRSLLILAGKLGMYAALASPQALWPDKDFFNLCKKEAESSGAAVVIASELTEVLLDADCIFTDSWLKSEPVPALCVSAESVARTGKSRVILLHGMSAGRGHEMSLDVFESPDSRVFSQFDALTAVARALLILFVK